jgi:hypothetical protein
MKTTNLTTAEMINALVCGVADRCTFFQPDIPMQDQHTTQYFIRDGDIYYQDIFSEGGYRGNECKMLPLIFARRWTLTNPDYRWNLLEVKE